MKTILDARSDKLIRDFPALMKSQGSTPCSQATNTTAYSDPVDFNPHFHAKFILKNFPSLSRGHKPHFTSSLEVAIFIISPVHSCPTISFLIVLTVLCQDYNL
jgi:hypothetical protein